MRHMSSTRLLVFFLVSSLGALAAAGVFARVHSPDEAVRLWKLHENQGGIFAVGKIVGRQIVKAELPDLGAVEVTRLDISVSAYAGKRADAGPTTSAYFLGGVAYQTSAQPSDTSTKIGAEGAFLLRPNPHPKGVAATWQIDGQNAVISGVRSASGELVLIGQGPGSVLARNARAESFLATHREALARVLDEEGKK